VEVSRGASEALVLDNLPPLPTGDVIFGEDVAVGRGGRSFPPARFSMQPISLGDQPLVATSAILSVTASDVLERKNPSAKLDKGL
jgi:hypothetical protein